MLLIFEILEFLVHILAADDKYSLLIETIYCNQFICNYLRKKSFPLFTSPILSSRSNFEHFEKKDDAHTIRIFKVTNSERRG